MGHAGIITAAKFSPDNNYIITVSADGGIYRWQNPYAQKERQKEPKEVPDVISVHSVPSTTKEAKEKDLEECITKTREIKCKCGLTSCKCPKLSVTTTKACKCTKPKCKCTLTVVKPIVKKSQSQLLHRKTIKVPKDDIGRNNIYGDYCLNPKKK